MSCQSAVSVAGSIDYERLVAPREHLGVLVEPRADEIARVLDCSACDAGGARILDTTVAELRERLRRRLGLSAPVILTGRQAEFSHAGVFAKTLAVAALRDACGGQAVFLSVDSDVPTANRLVVPRVESGRVRRGFAPIPACDPQLPIESQPTASVAAWRSFFDGVVGAYPESDDSLLATYAAGVFRDAAEELDLRSVVERGFEAVVRELGLGDIAVVRMSEICLTPEFRAFAAHLMLYAAKFAECYNLAQRDYRVRRHERNPRRPAPPLEATPTRVESPFWIVHAGGRRHRLFVARRGDQIEMYADQRRVGALSIANASSADAHDAVWPVEADGWRLRPRALTLSAFMRLFLSDLFVHGVGGVRYDEMTEDFVRRFLGVPPPPACCVTATLRLPLPRFGVDRAVLAAARAARRDIRFNPQRHLDKLPADMLKKRSELIGRSRELRTRTPRDHAARREVFDLLRGVNHDLLHHDAGRGAALEHQWLDLERRERSDRVADDREYFFAMHPRGAIEALAERMRDTLRM